MGLNVANQSFSTDSNSILRCQSLVDRPDIRLPKREKSKKKRRQVVQHWQRPGSVRRSGYIDRGARKRGGRFRWPWCWWWWWFRFTMMHVLVHTYTRFENRSNPACEKEKQYQNVAHPIPRKPLSQEDIVIFHSLHHDKPPFTAPGNITCSLDISHLLPEGPSFMIKLRVCMYIHTYLVTWPPARREVPSEPSLSLNAAGYNYNCRFVIFYFLGAQLDWQP